MHLFRVDLVRHRLIELLISSFKGVVPLLRFFVLLLRNASSQQRQCDYGQPGAERTFRAMHSAASFFDRTAGVTSTFLIKLLARGFDPQLKARANPGGRS
jgi:hypothetical protein